MCHSVQPMRGDVQFSNHDRTSMNNNAVSRLGATPSFPAPETGKELPVNNVRPPLIRQCQFFREGPSSRALRHRSRKTIFHSDGLIFCRLPYLRTGAVLISRVNRRKRRYAPSFPNRTFMPFSVSTGAQSQGRSEFHQTLSRTVECNQ